jgi:hypothetical protein
VSEEEWSVIHRFALALEKGRFNEYVEILQNTKKLFWKSFVSGVAKGLGAVVGATIVVAILAALLGVLGKYLPGKAGDFFHDTGNKIEKNVSQ